MSSEELDTNTQPETRWVDEAILADEKARVEIQREKEAAPVAIENLQGVGEVDADVQAMDDLNAVLKQSIDGRNLSQRQVNHARGAALQYEKDNPALSEEWANWARQSANHTGWVLARLAEGELPSGPPSRYAGELAGVTNRWAAQAELDGILAAHPPGTSGYLQRMNRVQALWHIIGGGENLVGRGGRTA